MSRLHALYFMLHTSYSMCMYLVLASQEVFIAIYISCPLRSWIATVIPIQRDNTRIKLLHLDYIFIRDRYRRMMSLASESAEEEETRLSRRRGRDRARRAAVFAGGEKLPRPETERGVSIQKARRKRTHVACIAENVSSYISYERH